MALVSGMRDTRATFDGWNRDLGPVLWRWTRASLAVALGLLAAVWVVARLSPIDPSALRLPGLGGRSTLGDVGEILFRNCLVLALHSLACVAGFIAGSSLPQQAMHRRGFSRLVHERAGPLAIAFVIGATTFSLTTQAYILGGSAATIAYHLHLPVAVLIVGLAPHAVPELTALFLPLAAWVLASRRGEWNELLAATFVTTAIAFPVLVISAFVEVYMSPHLIHALAA